MSTPVEWGSDAIAQAIRQTGVPFVTLNPGASFRGLHDSLVNFLGDERPQMLLCLHEEHAVAIAHGWAKVTGEPLGVILHSNVGLMHGSMAIFNGWCDRVPMLLIGATGPLDADIRRPWIDWIHTASDMPALVRNFVKWDDQPTTVAASVASILRANQLTRAYPSAPTYVCVDAAVQETPVQDWIPRSPERYKGMGDTEADASSLRRAVQTLSTASRPVIMMGHVDRSDASWQRRIALAERLGARVVTDLKMPAAFPTDHPLHGDTPGNSLSTQNCRILEEADVILSLEWEDLGGTLGRAFAGREPSATVISAGSEHQLFNGWTKNDYALAAVDIHLNCRPDAAVASLLEDLQASKKSAEPTPRKPAQYPGVPATRQEDCLAIGHLATALRTATQDQPTTLIRVPTSWPADQWHFTEPLAYLGSDGGGGVGSGPGLAVCAALALRGGDRLPVAVLGDGDYLMGLTALWTAASYDIPLLVVVANNGSFFNDELHQKRMAMVRGRPAQNAQIGMRIESPDADLAHLAVDMGLVGLGPARTLDELMDALSQAVDCVRQGSTCVVDVHVERSYSALAAANVLNDRSAFTAQPGRG